MKNPTAKAHLMALMIAIAGPAIVMSIGFVVVVDKICLSYQKAYDAELERVGIPFTMRRGEQTKARVTVRNRGRNTWTRGYHYYTLGFREGLTYRPPPLKIVEPSGFGNSNYDRVLLEPNDKTDSGQTKTFSFTIQAPSRPGNYLVTVQMAREGVTWFGESRTQVVEVR